MFIPDKQKAQPYEILRKLKKQNCKFIFVTKVTDLCRQKTRLCLDLFIFFSIASQQFYVMVT